MANQITAKNNCLWIWGYVLEEVPGIVPFVNLESSCSLETAAQYLKADNAVYMNSSSSMATLNDDLFEHMADFKMVLCGLEHGKYVEAATELSRFSLKHPNITGAIIDDFLDSVGPSAKMTPDELKEVQQALKSVNPNLKLYLVRYSRQNQEQLIPYLDYFDGISFWIWISTDHYWRSLYHYDIDALNCLCGKEILQGVFIHNYGEDYEAPMPLELLKLQVPKIAEELRTGAIDGWVILQNGWMGRENHREQVQFVKNYIDWFYGTLTLGRTKK